MFYRHDAARQVSCLPFRTFYNNLIHTDLNVKKLIFSLALCQLLMTHAWAQARKYTTFYEQRATLFDVLPVGPEDIIFLGNSITNGGEWAELFNNPHVKNRGISGDICEGVYDRLDAITSGKPAKIFLLIGINNVSRGLSADSIAAHIRRVVRKIKADTPRTRVYVQSVLPVNDTLGMFHDHTSRWQMIPQINALLRPMAREEGVEYIDLYTHFVDAATGKMNTAYTNDGLHLLGKGYLLWRDVVLPYVND